MQVIWVEEEDFLPTGVLYLVHNFFTVWNGPHLQIQTTSFRYKLVHISYEVHFQPRKEPIEINSRLESPYGLPLSIYMTKDEME